MGKIGNFGVKETAKAVFFNNAGQWIAVLLQFLFTILLVRQLPVSEYGIYVIFFGMIPFFGLLTFWGNPAITRFVPDFAAKGNIDSAKKLVWLIAVYCTIAGLAVIALTFIIPDFFQRIFGSMEFTPSLGQAFALILFLNFTTAVPLWTLNSLGHQKSRNFATIAYTALMLVLAFFLLNAGLGIKGVLIAIAASMILYLIMLAFFLKKKLFDFSGKSAERIDKKKIARYTFVSYLASFGELSIMLSVDILLLGILLGTEQTGLYGFATKIPSMLMNYSPAVLGVAVLFPFLVNKYTATKNKQVLSVFFETFTKFSAFFTIPLILVGIVLGIPIIRLVFSEKYVGTFPLFAFAMIVMGIVSLRSSLQNIYNTLEKPEIGIYSKVFFIFSSIAIILFAKQLGIFAAFSFTAIAMLLMTVSEYLMTARLVRLRIPFKPMLKIAFCSAVMATALALVYARIDSLPALIAAAVLGAIIYFALCLLVKPFESQDRQIFEKAGKLGRLLNYFSEK